MKLRLYFNVDNKYATKMYLRCSHIQHIMDTCNIYIMITKEIHSTHSLRILKYNYI